jgi:hypothetical protein
MKPAMAQALGRHKEVFEVRSSRKDSNKFLLILFGAEYSAQYAVNYLINGDDIEWKDPKTIVTSSGVKIYSPDLETLMEYEPTEQERAWRFPLPYSRYYAAFMSKAEEADAPSIMIETSAPKPKASPKPSEPKPNDMIGIQDIATELGMEPRDARQILRKHAEKPSWGWAWAKAEVAAIKKLLKEKRK